MFCGGNDEVLVRLMVLREIGLHADQPEWSPQALNAHFSFILFPFQFKTTAFRPAGAPNLSLTKEALIYSSMNRVASQIGKIATRTAQVVAGTLTPSRTDTRAPDLTATASLITSKTCSAGRGLAGELPRCAAGLGACRT